MRYQRTTYAQRRGGDPAVAIVGLVAQVGPCSMAHSRHVGVSFGALPAIVPAHSAVIGDSVLFRTFGASEFSRVTVGSVVAFEVDEYDRADSSG